MQRKSIEMLDHWTRIAEATRNYAPSRGENTFELISINDAGDTDLLAARIWQAIGDMAHIGICDIANVEEGVPSTPIAEMIELLHGAIATYADHCFNWFYHKEKAFYERDEAIHEMCEVFQGNITPAALTTPNIHPPTQTNLHSNTLQHNMSCCSFSRF